MNENQNNQSNNQHNQSHQQNRPNNQTQQPQHKPGKPEDIKRRNNTLIAIGVVILVIILALVAGKKKTEAPVVVPDTTTKDENMIDTNNSMKGIDSSYQTALEAYIGRSVQFDIVNNVCAAFPTTQVFKVGSRVLLDNHGTEPVTVTFGAKTLSLKPFHYATLPLPEEGTFGFTCDNKNVATVTVVK